MPTGSFEYRTDEERRAIEAAIAYVQQMRQLALDAPPGQVLAACEGHALGQGRHLLRENIRAALHERVARDEKKGAPPAAARAAGGCASRGAAAAR